MRLQAGHIDAGRRLCFFVELLHVASDLKANQHCVHRHGDDEHRDCRGHATIEC
jgi:hypothetical protein